MENNDGGGTDSASKIGTTVSKGKKPISSEAVEMDVVQLCASDLSSLQGVKTSVRLETGKKGELKKAPTGQGKDRQALREVTNNLDLQPVSFKPN